MLPVCVCGAQGASDTHSGLGDVDRGLFKLEDEDGAGALHNVEARLLAHVDAMQRLDARRQLSAALVAARLELFDGTGHGQPEAALEVGLCAALPLIIERV